MRWLPLYIMLPRYVLPWAGRLILIAGMVTAIVEFAENRRTLYLVALSALLALFLLWITLRPPGWRKHKSRRVDRLGMGGSGRGGYR